MIINSNLKTKTPKLVYSFYFYRKDARSSSCPDLIKTVIPEDIKESGIYVYQKIIIHNLVLL